MKKLFIFFLYSLLFSLPIVTFADNDILNWINTNGGSGYDEGYSIGIDSNKNVYVTGPFTGTVDFDPSDAVYNLSSLGGVDTFITKFDNWGNFIWVKKVGGSGDDRSFSMAVDSDGNSYTTGRFNSSNADFDPGENTYNLATSGSNDVYIVKLDTNGNFLWAKKLGGTNWEWPYALSIDSSGNVYTTGGFYGTADFDPGAPIYNLTASGGSPASYDDVFISKLDTNGNFLWAKQLGGSSYDWGAFVAVSSDGDVYTTGGFSGTADFDPSASTYNLTSTGSYDVFISKLDTNGNFLWAKKVGGTGEDYGNGLDANSSDGSLYITGLFSGTADFDPSASVSNMISSGSYDNFVLKLDSSGNFIWSKKTGGTGQDWGYTTKSRVENGNIYIYTGGTFSSTADFDPGNDTYNLVSNGSYDNFVLKLDSSGNFIWAHGFGGNSDDWLNYFVLDPDLGVYLTGSFIGTADLDPGDLTRSIISAGDSDIFFMKLANDITPPSITEFDVPEVYASLNLPVSLVAEDNVDVVSYIISENNIEPLPDDPSWSNDIPIEYVFSDTGQKNLYAWVKDEEGNISEMASAQILIDMDNPSIVLNGKRIITIYKNKEYVDKGATAYDFTDGDLTSNIVVVNNVNTDVIGTYAVTYNVSDSAGNNAVEVSRTVKVVKKPITGSIPFYINTSTLLHESNNQVHDLNILDNIEEDDNSEEESTSVLESELFNNDNKTEITTIENSAPTISPTLFRFLKRGIIGDDVKQLQVYLNTHDYELAKFGVGSNGHETNYFGDLTKTAVIRFQKDKGLDPDGIVGPLTKAQLK